MVAAPFVTQQILLNSLVSLLAGTTAPSSGGGVAAAIGSQYQEANTAAFWLKTGAAATAWQQLTQVTVVNVKSAPYNAVGDGVTDDRAAVQAAIAAAIAQDAFLFFPPGTYSLSKYLDFTGVYNTVVFGEDATILYPSANTAIPLDPVATTIMYAESGFFVRYAQNVLVKDLSFRGQDSTSIHDQLGSAIYGRYAVNLVVQNCHNYSGGTLFKQDETTPTVGLGLSLSVGAGGVVTLTANGSTLSQFHGGDLNQQLTLANCTNLLNDGAFTITSVISDTQVTFVNSDAVNETSSFNWSVSNEDDGMRVLGGSSFGAHGTCYTGNNGLIDGTTFAQLMDPDLTGLGDQFTLSGGTVTLTDQDANFPNTIAGKYVLVGNATTPGNDGLFGPIAWISATQISYANASGASELFTGSWYIQNGERVSIGAGAGAIVNAGGVTTFTAATGMFRASDVNKSFRPVNVTSLGNSGVFRVVSVISPTQITYNNVTGVTEAFSGQCAIDAYDNSQDGANTYGTTHALYLFGGRTNIRVVNCYFYGIRTTCMKISGSSGQVSGILIKGNVAIECAPFGIIGADDSQEHVGITIEGNFLYNCGTQRQGWNNNDGLTILGSRNTIIRGNHFHYDHNNIIGLSGLSVGGAHSISAQRYVFNSSQPLEALTIVDNIFTANPRTTTPNLVVQDTINAAYCGVLAKWNVAETISFHITGTTVTLTDPDANFLASSEVGESITIVNTPSGLNNGTFTILSVPSATTLTYTNAGGATVGSGNPGTYRIQPTRQASGAIIANNQSMVGNTAIDCSFNDTIEVHGNTWGDGVVSGIRFNGDCTPRAYGNREIGTATQSPRMRLDLGTSWPVIYDNHVTNPANSSSNPRDIEISINAGPAVDYPLLGKYVRARPTGALEEIVFAYGSLWVDGDIIVIVHGSSTTFTYKTTAPGANQFNSFASLLALFNGLAGTPVTADDYGTSFAAGAVPIQHVRVRNNVQTTGADGAFTIATTTLNRTAGVLLHNETLSNAGCQSRGAGTLTGGIVLADKTVIWSPMSTYAGAGASLTADNTAARTLLAQGAPATGSITNVVQADYTAANTDYVEVSDGINPSVLYGFDVTGAGVPAGRVDVNISADVTANDVATTLAAAVASNQPLFTVANLGTGVLDLTQNWYGPAGNLAIGNHVANGGFAVTGMAGGTIGGYQTVPNVNNGGCCWLLQHGNAGGTEEFRGVLAAAA